MPTERALPLPGMASLRGPSIVGVRWQSLLNGLLALAIASGCVASIEPSPYDVLILATFGLWLTGGFRVPLVIIPFAALLVLYNLGGYIALLPYYGEVDPTTFMTRSVYLAATAILFALFFAENTGERVDICLRAYAAGCVVAGVGAIVGYFDIAGMGEALTLYGRAAGTFKDPNVLGSYLILGALYYIQGLMLGRVRHPVPTLLGLAIILAGIFLSFSRGSWGALVGATTLMVGLGLLTQGDAMVRRRIVMMILLAAVVGAVVLAILLSIDSVREMFVERFALVQDYDTGNTGRFGNQLRAIPMLLDRLNGFGPVRFRLIFAEDAHSSYIGSFASYGWLGGSAFLLLVGLTMVVGFRQVLRPSPIQGVAQVFWPALFVLLVQAVQIDIDHWRHIYLLLGMVWGAEAARVRWQDRQRPAIRVGANVLQSKRIA